MGTKAVGESWFLVSLEKVTSESGEHGRLNGDYFLNLVSGAPEGVERWEVTFSPIAGYERMRLEIGPDQGCGGRVARVCFVGSAPSPVWSQHAIPGSPSLLRLALEPGTGPASNVRWPASLTAEQLVPSVAAPARAELKSLVPTTATTFDAAASSSGSPPAPYPPQYPPCSGGDGDQPQMMMMGPCPPPPTPPSQPPSASMNTTCTSGSSGNPVKYFNGELQISKTDLSSNGFGRTWGHTRTYSNQLSSTYNSGNGYNWVIRQWPYLSAASATLVTAVRGADWTVWFDKQAGGSYVARYSAKQTLVHTGSIFQLALTTGEVLEFNDFTQNSFPPGSFKSLTTTGGGALQVTSYSGVQIGEVQRSLTQGSDTVIESFLYTYFESGNNAGNLSSVTLRRNINGGPWSYVLQTVYTYYDLSDPNGNLGDLCTATCQVPNGTGWANTTVDYYRYYTGGAQTHLLKYVVGGSGYTALASQGDPLLASDAQVAQVATQYLQYDSSRRVTLESVAGGTLTTTLQYVDSGYTANTNFNSWTRKTTESRPDGSQIVVYTNYIGQVLLKDLQSGGNHWTEFYQYDSLANQISKANPSAVISYSEGSPAGTLNVNLQTNSGLINLVEYYQAPDPAAGYVKSKSIQQWNRPILPTLSMSQFTYTSQTVGPATVQKSPATLSIAMMTAPATSPPITATFGTPARFRCSSKQRLSRSFRSIKMASTLPTRSWNTTTLWAK